MIGLLFVVLLAVLVVVSWVSGYRHAYREQGKG